MKDTPLHDGLARRLQPLLRAEREAWQRGVLALMLTGAAVAVPLIAWWAMGRGLPPRSVWIAVGALVLLIEAAVVLRAMRRRTDPRELARRVESDIEGLLLMRKAPPLVARPRGRM